jgi:hypothetical protein
MCRLIFYMARLSDGYDDVYPSRRCACNSTVARPVTRKCMCDIHECQRGPAIKILLKYLQGSIDQRFAKVTSGDLKSLRKRIRQYMIDQEPDLNV